MSYKLTVAYEYGAEFAHEPEDMTVERAARDRFPGDDEAQRQFIQGFKDECERDWLRRQNG